MIMRGAVAARKLGIFERYVDEVYRHMWAEPKKLDDPAVLRAALVESELPADRLFELAQDAGGQGRLLAETQRAVDRGTFGSPTFFVDDEIYFGKDRLRDVEEAIAAQEIDRAFPARRGVILSAEGHERILLMPLVAVDGTPRLRGVREGSYFGSRTTLLSARRSMSARA